MEQGFIENQSKQSIGFHIHHEISFLLSKIIETQLDCAIECDQNEYDLNNLIEQQSRSVWKIITVNQYYKE